MNTKPEYTNNLRETDKVIIDTTKSLDPKVYKQILPGIQGKESLCHLTYFIP